MNLRSADLNLLVVLDALLDEAHVSRAALRLNLSQPATSASLGRLRQMFGDPLLERAEGGMRPTPVAEALRSRVKALLADAGAIIALQPERLQDIQKVVRIATADHLAARMGNALYARLLETAPNIDLVFDPYHGAPGALEGLRKGAVDLLLSILPSVTAPIRREELGREHWRVIMRSDHPAAAGFDLDKWISFPHIGVSGRGDLRTTVDDRIGAAGYQRRIAITVPSFLAVPPMVERSDLFGLLPLMSLPETLGQAFAVFEPPLPMGEIPLHLAWHERHDLDVAVQHVRSEIQELSLWSILNR